MLSRLGEPCSHNVGVRGHSSCHRHSTVTRQLAPRRVRRRGKKLFIRIR
ncbi:hypothetical protein FKM82_006943 [Ascaphus truei]